MYDIASEWRWEEEILFTFKSSGSTPLSNCNGFKWSLQSWILEHLYINELTHLDNHKMK